AALDEAEPPPVTPEQRIFCAVPGGLAHGLSVEARPSDCEPWPTWTPPPCGGAKRSMFVPPLAFPTVSLVAETGRWKLARRNGVGDVNGVQVASLGRRRPSGQVGCCVPNPALLWGVPAIT